MKTIHKRAIVAASALALAVGFQWLSGIPFQRSPEEAYAAFCAVFFAIWLAAYPGIDE